jgi:50S ribosomal protein L16 3-hydroxylase
VQNYLAFLAQEVQPSAALYADADLTAQTHPAELTDATLARFDDILAEVRVDRDRLARFVGRYLTGPKPGTQYKKPKPTLDERAFARRLDQSGTLALAPQSRMLFVTDVGGVRVFLNGEPHRALETDAAALRRLADTRALPLPAALSPAGRAQLHRWWRAGYLTLS